MTVAQVVREPLYRTVPDCRSSFGDLAARVGEQIGLPPDDEQRVALDAMFTEAEPGIPRYRHVCMVATRQQIKSATLTIAAATDLLLLGVPGAVWTAHQSKTATKSYEDLSRRIRGHEEYREVCGFRSGRGEEAVYLLDDPGVSLEYRARSGGSGRGFTTGRLTLDEALYLRAGDIGALAPTMLTRREGQIRYGSSAGLPGSEVLRSLRDDGRAGSDPGLWYVEYGSHRRDCEQPFCAHEPGSQGCALDDRELWWQACPALWCGRVREEDVADLRRRMPAAEFAREVLGWWDEPADGGTSAFDPDAWAALSGLIVPPSSPVFAVATAPDSSWSAIAVASRLPSDRCQVTLTGDGDTIVDYRPPGPWVAERVAELRARWGGRVVSDKASLRLVPDAERPDPGQAHNALADAVNAGTVLHGNEPALNLAVKASRWKSSGDTRVLDRKGTADISPLIAAALAVHALVSTPPPVVVYPSTRPTVGADPVLSAAIAGFSTSEGGGW